MRPAMLNFCYKPNSDITMPTMLAEMASFLSKLSQLNSFGFNAQLNFNACGGRKFVNMEADLSHASDYCQYLPKTRTKPSRLRRRRRRQAHRENPPKASSDQDFTEDLTENDVELETVPAPSYNCFT